MPRPTSVFIDFHGDEAALVDALAEVLGCPLVREDLDVGTLYRCRLLDTELVLFGDHGLEDDCGIRFTEYSHQLQLTAFDVGVRIPGYDRMYESMAVFLGERLSVRLDSRTLVVANLQRTVAVFSAGAAAAERAGAGAGHGDDSSHGEQGATTPGDGLSCRRIDETMTRLKWSIQALAAPAAAQVRLFPRFVCVADELAVDFEEALRGIRSAGSSDAGDREETEGPERAGALSPAQRAAVDALDAQLEKMSGPERAEMWTDDALHNSAEWTRVRHLAALALRTMDWPMELPPQGRAIYVGPPDRGDDTT